MVVIEGGGEWESTIIRFATEGTSSPGQDVISLASTETSAVEESGVETGRRSSGTKEVGRGGRSASGGVEGKFLESGGTRD